MGDTGGRTAALLFLLLAGAACGRPARERPAAGPVVTDDAGRIVRLARPARRVVSLVPSINETLVALGAAERAIARSDYDHAPQLARLPSIGGGLTPNIEWLAARRPDLVFSWPDQRSRAVVSRLQAVGIPAYAARVETLEDSYRTTLNIGRLLGLDSAARALVARQRAQLAEIARRAAAEPPPRVLYLIGIDPPEVAGAGTFVDELLHIAGGSNVFRDLHLWPTVSVEEALRRDPDVIVLAIYGGGDAVARLRAAPGWAALRAARAGRIVGLDPDLANRPGPRAVEAAELLFHALHPGLAGAQPGGLPLSTGGSGKARALVGDSETAGRRDGGSGASWAVPGRSSPAVTSGARPAREGAEPSSLSRRLAVPLSRRLTSSPSRRPAVPPSAGTRP